MYCEETEQHISEAVKHLNVEGKHTFFTSSILLLLHNIQSITIRFIFHVKNELIDKEEDRKST